MRLAQTEVRWLWQRLDRFARASQLIDTILDDKEENAIRQQEQPNFWIITAVMYENDKMKAKVN
jgi:hypothetical protein